MNRRVEIILERYKDDYPKAMGELNVRRLELEKRLTVACGRTELAAIVSELNDIGKLLLEYQKPIPKPS